MAMFNDFGLTEEQKMMRDSLLRLAARTLPAEKIRELDRQSGWPHEAYQALAKAGCDSAGHDLAGHQAELAEIHNRVADYAIKPRGISG